MRAICLAIVAIIAALGHTFEIPETYTASFKGAVLTPVDGVWMWNSGAVVSIKSDSNGGFDITLLDSPDPDIQTPEKIGHGYFSGTPGKYDVELFSKKGLRHKHPFSNKVSFVATVSEHGRLILTPQNKVWIDAWRIIPYLFRVSVRRTSPPDKTETAIRIWPRTGSPEMPVVL